MPDPKRVRELAERCRLIPGHPDWADTADALEAALRLERVMRVIASGQCDHGESCDESEIGLCTVCVARAALAEWAELKCCPICKGTGLHPGEYMCAECKGSGTQKAPKQPYRCKCSEESHRSEAPSKCTACGYSGEPMYHCEQREGDPWALNHYDCPRCGAQWEG